MQTHVNEESWAAALSGELGATSQAHFETCAECRAEAQSLKRALDGARESLDAAAERSEVFWIRQRAEISARIRQQRDVRHRLVLATAVASLTLAASLLMRQAPPQTASPQVSDQELMTQIESSVMREVPNALAPSAMLAQEMAQAAQKNSNDEKGEQQ